MDCVTSPASSHFLLLAVSRGQLNYLKMYNLQCMRLTDGLTFYIILAEGLFQEQEFKKSLIVYAEIFMCVYILGILVS